MAWTTYSFLVLFFVLNLFPISVLAEPINTNVRRNVGTCKEILQRKEWRALTDHEKKCYIDAVKCLQKLPAHNASQPGLTRFDEFQDTHIGLALKVHYLGQFLPWHRLFMKSYENALRDECGYKGAQPYWDWTIDSDYPNKISQSPILDPVTGFGGDGLPGTYTLPPDPTNTSKLLGDEFYHGCIQDGPFANYTLKLGPGLFITNHCITRGVNDTWNPHVNSSAVAYALSFSTFEEFRVKLEGTTVPPDIGPHGGGHVSVGGDMSNYFSSPGDPLFYMHHTNLDRIWWIWQQASLDRLYEISGPTSQTPPYGNITLDYPLQMGNIGTTLPLRKVMDIREDPSCFTYV